MLNRSYKTILIFFAVFSLLIILTVIISEVPSRGTNENLHSAFNSNPAGVKALYLLLKESGYQTERRQKSIETLSRLNPDSVLYISVAPSEPYKHSEADSLESIVRRGATAILFINNALDSVVTKFGIYSRLTLRDSIYVRQQLVYSNMFYDSLFAGSDTPNDRGAKVKVLHSESADYQPLYGTDKNHAVITVPHGKGELVVFNSPDYITNLNIDRYQNINIFMNILYQTADGKARYNRTIIFDEYHQGYKEFESVITVLDEPPVRFAILIAVAGLLMLIYSKSKRITRPVPVQKVITRDSQAYLDSVTQAYKRSGAHRLAIHIWYSWIKRQLSLRYKTTLESKWIKALSEQHQFNETELNQMFSRLNALQYEKNHFQTKSDLVKKREPVITDQELIYYFRLLNKIYNASKSGFSAVSKSGLQKKEKV